MRREISAQGRSRAFIDDELVTSNALKELGSRLVDLHGQHEHQALLDPRSHVDVLDEHAGLSAERAAVSVAFDRWRSVRTELERVRASEREQATRVELLAFQLGELERAAPQPDEDRELGATRQILANAERLQRLCSEGYVELYEGDEAVLAHLEGLWRRLSELAALDPKFTPYLEVRESVKPQLEDLAFFLRSYGSAVEASPERLQHVEDRLALLERLKKKYGPSLSDVIARRVTLENELETVSTAAERVAGLERELGEATGAYVGAAETLSRARRAAAQTLASKLERLLAELAMERSRLEVRFNEAAMPEGEWTERGRDGVEFYFSANPGEDLRPLAKIASGGELSRVMLALKTLASTDVPGKTLIFDEVDAGIGGRVAESVGYKLNGFGRQVSGRLRDAPPADRCLRSSPLPRVEECPARAYDHACGPLDRGGAGRGNWKTDDRREGVGERARQCAGATRRDGRAVARTKDERRKRKGRGLARKYRIETFGCQMNFHDSERLAGLLEQAGYEPTDDDADADVLVVNTCSVRERAEEKLFSRLGRVAAAGGGARPRPVVAVAGCVAQQEGAQDSPPGTRRRCHRGDASAQATSRPD